MTNYRSSSKMKSRKNLQRKNKEKRKNPPEKAFRKEEELKKFKGEEVHTEEVEMFNQNQITDKTSFQKSEENVQAIDDYVEEMSEEARNYRSKSREKMSSKMFCLILGYVGSDFCGFQKQVDRMNVERVYTVESELENVLKKCDIMKVNQKLRDVKWSKAARTDKKVHAALQVVGMKIALPIIEDEEEKKKKNEVGQASLRNVEEEENEIRKETEGGAAAAEENGRAGKPKGKGGLVSEEEKAQKKGVAENEISLDFLSCKHGGFNLICDESSQEAKKHETDKVDVDEKRRSVVSKSVSFLLKKINLCLPESVQIYAIYRASKMFDARLCCSKRCYEYLLPTYTLKKLDKEALEKMKLEYDFFMNKKLKASVNSVFVKEKPDQSITFSASSPCSSLLNSENFDSSNVSNPVVEDVNFESEVYSDIDKKSEWFQEKECQEFLRILKEYEGTKNFYNFTSKIGNDNATVVRYIQNIEANLYEMDNIKYVRIEIIGQSFLLNQIRKMIGLAVEVYKGSANSDAIDFCLKPNKVKKFVHMAPAEGLLLANVLYDAYNERRATTPDTPCLTWEKIEEKVEAFKSEKIYLEIQKAEKRGIWISWILKHVCRYPFFLTNSTSE